MDTKITTTDREFIMERVFDAPRQLVFEAMSKPEHLVNWWGPQGWTLPVCKLDFRPGGIWHFCMQGPDGEEAWGKAVYREIVAPERIVYTDMFSDAEGNTVADMPETLITMEFIEQDGKTRLVSTAVYATAADLETVIKMGMEEGASQTWDRFADYLKTQV
ncbi:MAG: SRPBCC domain-containing protein [Anaerolineae bacterium]|nr:SRPBCC domain-containing protein [Anaerolineae bacterium]